MTDQDKERIEKLENYLDSIPKEELDKIIDDVDKLGIEGPTVEEYFNPAQAAFNQGKIEGFNEGIEATIKQISNLFPIYARVNISWLEVLEEIEKLKKPI